MPLWYYFSDIFSLAASDYNRGWSPALKELDTWRVFESSPLPPPCCTLSWDMLVSEVSGRWKQVIFGSWGSNSFFSLLVVYVYGSEYWMYSTV